MTFSLGKLRLRVHPAFPMMLMMSIAGGGGAHALSLMLALLFHEGCHALAAHALGIRVLEIELLPFGGAARLEDLWGLRPGQLIAVALAGPFGSMLLLFAALLLPSVLWLSDEFVRAFASANLTILLLNLLPALPLDGGRVLCGLLSRKLGGARAAKIGIVMGRLLAVGLAGYTIWCFFSVGHFEPAPLLCAVFLIASARRERMAAGSAALLSMMDRQGEMASEEALPLRWLAASEGTKLRALLLKLQPRALYRVAVYDQNMRLRGVLDEAAIVDAALRDTDMTLGQLSGARSEG